ncbi:MAG TPA: hypothetical protein VMW87_02250 [Spirochaetia bacterium]|nr:hypothetical protein [Spirochaetia bacterium]
MPSEIEFPVTLFLSKEKISLMPRDELSAFLQVLRIDNAIRTPMKLHLKLRDNPDGVESTKDKIDLMLQMVATYYEGVRTFARNLYPRLNVARYLSPDRQVWFESLRERLNKLDEDYFLKMAATIRDKIVGHFDHDVILSSVTEGAATEDFLFAYLKDATVNGFVAVEPYSMVGGFLSKLLPPEVPKGDTWMWINDTAFREADLFCRFLEHFSAAFAAENGVKRRGLPLGNGGETLGSF